MDATLERGSVGSESSASFPHSGLDDRDHLILVELWHSLVPPARGAGFTSLPQIRLLILYPVELTPPRYSYHLGSTFHRIADSSVT